jgi:hypothetical protein
MQDVPAPLPPIPDIPPIPDFPFIVGGGPPPEIFFVAVVSILVAGVLLWPVVRAWARRLERGTAGAGLQGELDQMRAKVAELDELHHRVAELEERLDFSERILAQRAPEALPRGGP